MRVANLVKQISANAQVGATLDQASDHSAQTKPGREPFELNITEDPPTTDQVQTILGYVGTGGISKVIKGARDEKDALKRFKESKENFLRPLVCLCLRESSIHAQLTNMIHQTVDWNNGKAVAGDNESEILKILNAQKTD